MESRKGAAKDFLSQRRIAVAGVSRSGRKAANLIYRKLRGAGYEVFPVNPRADQVEGDPCYPDLGSIPGGVDGVVISTKPESARVLVQECCRLGIPRVWMHRSLGEGSVSEEGVRLAREKGIRIIAGGCPMMFCEPVDFGHRCLRWFLGWSGRLPGNI